MGPGDGSPRHPSRRPAAAASGRRGDGQSPRGRAHDRQRPVRRHGGADGGLRASRVRRSRGGGRSGGRHPMAATGTIEVRPIWHELPDRATTVTTCDGNIVRTASSGDDGLGKVVWSATTSLDGFIAGPGRRDGLAVATTLARAIRGRGDYRARQSPDPCRRSYDVRPAAAERPEVESRSAAAGRACSPPLRCIRAHDPAAANTLLLLPYRRRCWHSRSTVAEGKDLTYDLGADVARQRRPGRAGLSRHRDVESVHGVDLLQDGVRSTSRLDKYLVETLTPRRPPARET